MNNYAVELEYTHDFKVDLKSLCKWALDTISLKVESQSDQWIIFYKEGNLISDDTNKYRSEEHKQLKEHYDSLTEDSEAAKLALPSRMEGEALSDWKTAKKTEIATITDFSTLTEGQRKLWMDLELTDDEKDHLGV